MAIFHTHTPSGQEAKGLRLPGLYIEMKGVVLTLV